MAAAQCPSPPARARARRGPRLRQLPVALRQPPEAPFHENVRGVLLRRAGEVQPPQRVRGGVAAALGKAKDRGRQEVAGAEEGD